MDSGDRIKIRAFVATLLEEHDDRAPFADGESLIQAGRLDSLAAVTLVSFLESGFGVDFARIEFDPQRAREATDNIRLVALNDVVIQLAPLSIDSHASRMTAMSSMKPPST